MLTQADLKEYLYYNPDTGIFTWIKKPHRLANRTRIGASAGYLSHGYIAICIHRKNYLAHRLAWLYMHGEWPIFEIDHINQDKKDNKISNLRDTPHSFNAINKKKQINNTSGYKGVYWHSVNNNWEARISKNGQPIYCGCSDSAAEAAKMYDEKAEKLFGISAFLNFPKESFVCG